MDDVTRRDIVTAAVGAVGLSVFAVPAQAAGEQKPGRGGALEGSEFIVKLNGIQLPAAEEARIASELQATMMRELAKTDLNRAGLGGGLGLQIPIKWKGIWVDKIARPDIPVLRTQRE